jgi:hypothetical protein
MMALASLAGGDELAGLLARVVDEAVDDEVGVGGRR